MFWYIASCSLVEVLIASIIRELSSWWWITEHLWNIGKLVRDYTEQYTVRMLSPHKPPGERQISHNTSYLYSQAPSLKDWSDDGITSAVSVTKVGKSPHIGEVDSETNYREQEVCAAAPRFSAVSTGCWTAVHGARTSRGHYQRFVPLFAFF
jgi:hypothetical protein